MHAKPHFNHFQTTEESFEQFESTKDLIQTFETNYSETTQEAELLNLFKLDEAHEIVLQEDILNISQSKLLEIARIQREINSTTIIKSNMANIKLPKSYK